MPDQYSKILPISAHGQSAYAVARYAAVESGKILKARFGLHNKMQVKGIRNLVTEVDILSEKKIMGIIAEEYTEHSILSEESGDKRQAGEYTWIIDPLDGTNNYSSLAFLFSA